MKRFAMGVFALVMALGFAGAAQSQVICSKTNNKGKTKFKLRDVCKSNEVVSQDFAGFAPGDVVTTGDLPGAPADLLIAADLPAAPGDLATMADVDAIPRVSALGFTNDGFQSQAFDEAPLQLAIDDGATTVQVATTRASATLHITFSAECRVSSNNLGDWANLDLIVNGNVIAPTDGDNAFCHSEGDDSSVHYRTDSTTVVVSGLAAGTHTIEATVRLQGVGNGFLTLDDVGLAVVVID